MSTRCNRSCDSECLVSNRNRRFSLYVFVRNRKVCTCRIIFSGPGPISAYLTISRTVPYSRRASVNFDCDPGGKLCTLRKLEKESRSLWLCWQRRSNRPEKFRDIVHPVQKTRDDIGRSIAPLSIEPSSSVHGESTVTVTEFHHFNSIFESLPLEVHYGKPNLF